MALGDRDVSLAALARSSEDSGSLGDQHRFDLGPQVVEKQAVVDVVQRPDPGADPPQLDVAIHGQEATLDVFLAVGLEPAVKDVADRALADNGPIACFPATARRSRPTSCCRLRRFL